MFHLLQDVEVIENTIEQLTPELIEKSVFHVYFFYQGVQYEATIMKNYEINEWCVTDICIPLKNLQSYQGNSIFSLYQLKRKLPHRNIEQLSSRLFENRKVLEMIMLLENKKRHV